LVVIGGGFDPRTARALSAIASGASAPLRVICLELSPDIIDETTSRLASETRAAVETIANSAGTITYHSYPQTATRRSADISVSRSFHESRYLDGFRQVVIDVSGLPRSIFFPLIEGMLQTAHSGTWNGDLHIAVCDNPAADASILTEGAENPVPLGGFAGNTDAGLKSTIWVPILGEGRSDELIAIWEDLTPDEVIPVLPFPSRNPRRADDLILEYRELLFDVVQVEPRNFLHASESNPFDLYRSLARLYGRYQEALDELGGAEVVLSTHSSKLLSLGALMAAHEFRMRVHQVTPTRSGVRADVDLDELRSGGVLANLWILGGPYE